MNDAPIVQTALYPQGAVGFSQGSWRWLLAFLLVSALFAWGGWFLASCSRQQMLPFSQASAAIRVSLVTLPSTPKAPPPAPRQHTDPAREKSLAKPAPMETKLRALPPPAKTGILLPPRRVVRPPQHLQTRSSPVKEAAHSSSPQTRPVPDIVSAPVNQSVVKGRNVAAAQNISSLTLPDWEALLLKQLRLAEHYPQAALADREQGVALVRFSMDRRGQVLSVEIVKSAGYAALDAEAIALVHRAAPLPMPPARFKGDSFTLTVPVVFTLGSNGVLDDEN